MMLNNNAYILTSLINDIKESNKVIVGFFTRQRQFNKEVLAEIKDVKIILLNVPGQLEGRLKAIDERENRFEERLARVESFLNL